MTLGLNNTSNYNQYHNIEPSNKFRLTLSTSKGMVFLDIKDIIYCEASSNYTIFHCRDNKKCMVSKTLKNYEELLTSFNFIRIHHSFLINLREVNIYIKGEGGSVIMSNGTSLNVAKRKRDNFLSTLSFISITSN